MKKTRGNNRSTAAKMFIVEQILANTPTASNQEINKALLAVKTTGKQTFTRGLSTALLAGLRKRLGLTGGKLREKAKASQTPEFRVELLERKVALLNTKLRAHEVKFAELQDIIDAVPGMKMAQAKLQGRPTPPITQPLLRPTADQLNSTRAV